VVELKPFKKIKTPVTLQQVKADKRFETMELVRLMRLSVSAVKPEEFDAIMDLGGMG
jgi:predicted RNA-binding protein with PUA-like domain